MQFDPPIVTLDQLQKNEAAKRIVDQCIQDYKGIDNKQWKKMSLFLRLHQINLRPIMIMHYSQKTRIFMSEQKSQMFKQALNVNFNFVTLTEYFNQNNVFKTHFNDVCRFKFRLAMKALIQMFSRFKTKAYRYFSQIRTNSVILYFQLLDVPSEEPTCIIMQGSIEQLKSILLMHEQIADHDRTQKYRQLREFISRNKFDKIIEHLIYINEIFKIVDKTTCTDEQILQQGKKGKNQSLIQCLKSQLLKQTISENRETPFYQLIVERFSNKIYYDNFTNANTDRAVIHAQIDNEFIVNPYEDHKKIIKIPSMPLLKTKQKSKGFLNNMSFMHYDSQRFHKDFINELNQDDEQDSFDDYLNPTSQPTPLLPLSSIDELIEIQIQQDKNFKQLVETNIQLLKRQLYDEFIINKNSSGTK